MHLRQAFSQWNLHSCKELFEVEMWCLVILDYSGGRFPLLFDSVSLRIADGLEQASWNFSKSKYLHLTPVCSQG